MKDSLSWTITRTQIAKTKSSGVAKPSTAAAVTSQITTSSQTSRSRNRTSATPKLSTLSTRTTSSRPFSSSTDACKFGKAKRGDDLYVRTVNQLHMKRWKGTTYTAFDPARQLAMDPCVVRRYAERGYVQIENLQPSLNGIVLVSALFILNLGVFVRSKPRGARGEEEETSVALYFKAKKEFSPWLLYLEGRGDRTGPSPSPTDDYHAED